MSTICLTDDFLCPICFIKLSNKKYLNRHQQSKKCLQQRELNQQTNIKLNNENEIKKLNQNITELNQIITELNLTNKYLLEWKERQIEKMEKQLDGANKFIRKQANEPKIVNNNNGTINNTINYMPTEKLDISDEKIEHVFKTKFNEKVIKTGMKGFANFTFDNFFIDENKNLLLVCTDLSRKNFRYRDKDNKLVYDPKA